MTITDERVSPQTPDDTTSTVDGTTEVEAPYGWMTDRKTGERRPRKRPPFNTAGRRGKRKPPKDDGGDRAPGEPATARRFLGGDKPPKSEAEYPPFRAGPIAKGMNRLYHRAGKIIKMFDPALGAAFVASATKADDEDVTVGEAWEEIARTNPKLRAIMLRMIEGNAWAQLFMAHAPIMLAVAMKPGVREHLPFGRLLEAFLDDGPEGEPSAASDMFGGMTPADAAQMMGVAQGLMAHMTAGMPRERDPLQPRRGSAFSPGRPMVDIVQDPLLGQLVAQIPRDEQGS